MPKPVKILIEVEELHVGRVMRQLHNTPGVATVNLDLGTPTHQKLNGSGVDRGPYKKFDKKAEEFIAELLMKQPMPTKVIRDHFADIGRRPGSTSSALNLMVTAGDIKKQDDGKTWMLTKKARDRMRHRATAK